MTRSRSTRNEPGILYLYRIFCRNNQLHKKKNKPKLIRNMSQGGWDTSLFECFTDVKILLGTCVCFPCQVAYQKATVEEHQCSFSDAIMTTCCSVCCGVVVRQKIRDKYKIPGSFLVDLLLVIGCCPCALSQQSRQLRIKGDKPGAMCMDN